MVLKNFDAQLVDFEGKLVFESKADSIGNIILDEDKKRIAIPVNLNTMVSIAVGQKYQTDTNLSFDQQFLRGQLARKLAKGGNIELEEEEITMIKECLRLGSSLAVVLQAGEALKKEVLN